MAKNSQQETSKEQEEAGFLPIIQFGTPPLTPDSSAEGTARVGNGKGKGKYPDDELKRAELSRKNVETDNSVHHTRQERMWLHINYRGEAPFLQAWGLNIANLSDRLEGLSILRELMQAETEKSG